MVVVVMGVAGSGKTTVGRALAAELGWEFYDADDFHPPSNVAKMARGVPLDDEDRRPWLEALRAVVRGALGRGASAVLACSALRESYRERLLLDERVRLVYLKGGRDIIRRRLEERRGHFMNPSLLDSQLAALEEPAPETHFDINLAPAELVAAVRRRLGL
jgi:gluconokinase